MGGVSIPLARRGFLVTDVACSPAMLEIARWKASRLSCVGRGMGRGRDCQIPAELVSG